MIRFRDRLAHLNYRQACKLLGPRLIREGGQSEIDLVSQVRLDQESLTLSWNCCKVHIRGEDGKPENCPFPARGIGLGCQGRISGPFDSLARPGMSGHGKQVDRGKLQNFRGKQKISGTGSRVR